MSAMVRAINKAYVTRACGRACTDMQPDTRPVVPLSPPVSLMELLRSHPDLQLDPESLAEMEASDTLH